MIVSILIGIVALAPATHAATHATQPATRAAPPPRRTFAEAKRVFETAMAKAQEQFLQAQLAARKAYLADLNVAVNVAMRAEKLQDANDAKSARDDVSRGIEQLDNRLKGRPELPIGVWDVTYSNGASGSCRIAADGSWEKLQSPGSTPARVRVADNGELLVTFRDGDVQKTERLMLTTNGLLVIEHYNPASALGKGPPTTIGIGRLQP